MLITACRPTAATASRGPALDVPGTVVHPNMLEKLSDLGDSVVKDARELTDDQARERLLEQGFVREDDGSKEYQSYTLGRAHLWGAGQRVLFHADRSLELVTLADQWVQVTRLDSQGRRVSNAVERIPH